MLPLNEHIAILSDIMTSKHEDIHLWAGAYEWLKIAASIESIKLDTLKYDHSFGLCESAYKYDIARDALLQSFTKHLAIFNFVWGGLESTIEIIKPPKNPDKSLRGKVSDTCLLLRNVENTVPELLNQTKLFKEIASRRFGYSKVEDRFDKAGYFGELGIGLYAVYAFRNQFAHGSMIFPQPEDDDKPICIENELVMIATRIVLLSMQLLLIHHNQNAKNYEIYLVSYKNWLGGELLLDTALRTCHLPAE
ncbi:TPA: hypothetical protein ACNUUK_001922 [Aeromonas salmonicida subsp. smithia]